MHAFVSQGFALSTDNNYLTESKHGSLDFTEAAINIRRPIGERLTVGLQLYSRKVDPNDNYLPVFDWFNVDYRFADWLGIRVGRVKIPFGLYNDTIDIDAARVPVLLPAAVYPDDLRNLLFAMTGAELYDNFNLGVVGELEYRIYGGTFFMPKTGRAPNPGVSIADTKVHYIFGGRLMWLTPIDGLQIGGSLQQLRYEIDYAFDPALAQIFVAMNLAPAGFTGAVNLDYPIRRWVASAEYTVGDLAVAAEYGRWVADLESSVPQLLPSGGPTNERFYAMASYRLTSWFTPGAYYSAYYLDIEQRSGRANHQHDYAATLRFDLTSNWIFKVEGHLMRGTAALEPGLNDGVDRKQLTKNWGLLLLKTTAYF